MSDTGCYITPADSGEITCTWEWDDGTRCGQPADAFRVQWLPTERRWYYCRRHIRTLRHLTADEEAWRLYQTATYAVAS